VPNHSAFWKRNPTGRIILPSGNQRTILARRSREAGRAIQCVPQPRCLKKEREHRRLSARAPSYMKQFSNPLNELSSLKAAHGPISTRNASEWSSIKIQRNSTRSWQMLASEGVSPSRTSEREAPSVAQRNRLKDCDRDANSAFQYTHKERRGAGNRSGIVYARSARNRLRNPLTCFRIRQPKAHSNKTR
jgi:hypothetical protein